MKRILFVDGESTVLDGLRRLLHGERNRWGIQFMQGAEQALRAFESSALDVVVTT